MTKAAELAKMGEVLTNSQIGGRRNIIINGAMQVAQRGTSTTLAHDGTTDGYSPDRFRFTMGGTHEQLDGTVAQVADHPTSANGKSLKWTTGTAESSYDADEYVYIVQKIEAQNLQHLQYGNSNAEAITISFYVKSSITGTYAFGLYKEDSTARIFNKTYTIDSANTWEKKTLTFVGDTDSGAGIVNDNGTGLYVSWHLSAGTNIKGGGSVGAWKNYSGLTDWADGQATNAIMTTASATFQITECQLEIGEQATPFEHRSFGEELALCYRYYEQWDLFSGENIWYGGALSGNPSCIMPFMYKKRAAPTVTIPSTGGSGSGDTVTFLAQTGSFPSTIGTISASKISDRAFRLTSTGYSGITASAAVILYSNGVGTMQFNAEL